LGDNTKDSSKNIHQKKYSSADSFKVKLLVISNDGCRDSLVKKVVILPNTNVNFDINSATQCFNGHTFNFTNLSLLSDGTFSSRWQLGDGDSTNTKDVSNKKYSRDSTYLVRLITVTNLGCTDTLSKNVILHPNPQASFTINKNIQCFKWNSFDFLNNSFVKNGNIAANHWNLGDGDTRNSKDVFAKNYTKVDSFRVELIVTSEYGCRDSIHRYVKTLAMDAGFDVLVDSSSCPVYTFINTGSNFNAIKWNLDDEGSGEKNNKPIVSQFTHKFSKEGKFRPCLVIDFNNTCRDTICKDIEFKVTKNLNIPNVFTPGNNDNLNDVFDIETLGIEEYHLSIFNRWGQMIFETQKDGIRNDGNNWTGQIENGTALYPDGTYFYILDYRYKCEEKLSKVSGTVTLIGKE
jgi:gliding motility-associated-like protein